MNILVAGATGKTGQRLVQKLSARDHDVVALVREDSDTSVLPSQTEQRLGDLTELDENVCEGCDAVIFAAGSGGDTDAEMTDKVDRDGAIALIDLARKANVDRFVMLSSVGAGSPDDTGDMEHYLQAKHDADEHLKQSGMPYAIVRPVSLTDDPGTGKVIFGDKVDRQGTAIRDDVAMILAKAVHEDSWRNEVKLMETMQL